MNTIELTNQLSALSDSLKTTNLLINRLAKLTFQPGSEPLEGDSGVRVELSQDIHDSLKQLEEELEFLKQEADDYKERISQRRRPRETDEVRITAKVVKIGEELAHSRQQFRNAQISAKFASEQAKRQEREALLEGYRREAEQLAAEEGATTNGSIDGDPREQLFARRRIHQQQKQLTKDEILVNASTDVTSALRRTHALLSTELERSRFAQETFDESTSALKQLGEEYSNIGDILSKSKGFLGTLLRSQKSDTWYLETAFYILVATLIWLVFRRLLYGPFIKLPWFFVNTAIFLLNWIFLKPLFFLLTLVGVITTEPSSSLTSNNIPTSSRPPLIIQPSAKGKASRLPEDSFKGIPAGAGGAGAKAGKDPNLDAKLSEQIGKMAEESAKQQNEPVKRGDGTVLEERGDVPKNPKKKNFEADVEDQKQKEKQVEAEREKSQRQKRDEL